jgi:hypothetical protein
MPGYVLCADKCVKDTTLPDQKIKRIRSATEYSRENYTCTISYLQLSVVILRSLRFLCWFRNICFQVRNVDAFLLIIWYVRSHVGSKVMCYSFSPTDFRAFWYYSA